VGDIEREWTVCVHDDGHAVVYSREHAPRYQFEGWTCTDMVPASQLTGAVEACEAAREFAGNFIRYVDDDEHLLAEQAWDVVRKVNAAIGGQ
jgi:hypothetical protein